MWARFLYTSALRRLRVLGEELLGLKTELSTLFGWFAIKESWLFSSNSFGSASNLSCVWLGRINQILANCGMDVAFRPDNSPELAAQAVPPPCAGLPPFVMGMDVGLVGWVGFALFESCFPDFPWPKCISMYICSCILQAFAYQFWVSFEKLKL